MEKKTIYQRLEDLFGPEKHKISKSRYSLDDKQLLKTQSKEEYEVAKLQAQQNKYLSSQWQKVDGELFQQSVYYETTRIASYSDFEGMEFYPEIAAALDIFMEEATCSNSEGRVLNIFSESKRVKRILQDLFFNRLDIHTSLPMWTRNTCKYGDNVLFLKIEDEKGIVGAKQLPNIEIERKEADNYRIYNANDPLVKEGKKDTVSFFWKNKDITFNSWQIAHFRLLGDDRRLPYGTSILEKARRIWKQLLLSEDAMLVYRVTRAPERRIFKIYVGNIDEQDVPSYVQKIANNFKKTPVIDQRTGQIDTRYNQMAQDQDYFIPVRDASAPSPIDTLPGACIDLNTRIPLLDGRTLKLSEIIEEWDNGNRNIWAYSCDPNTGEFVPGIITWAGITRKNADVLKITLDNGEEIITTPDHKFVHRTNGFVEAKDLKVDDSLMSFNRKKNILYGNKDYEQVYDHSINKWVWTHKKVSNFHKENLSKEHIFNESKDNLNKNTIHHIDFNRFNNRPDNLVFMNFNDHLELHSKSTDIATKSFVKKYNEDSEFKNKINNILKNNRTKFHEKRNSDNEYKELIKSKQKESLKLFFDGMTPEELNKWSERINNPISKAKTTKKLLEYRKQYGINELIGKKISKTKSDPERKKIYSDNSKKLWNNIEYSNKVFSKKQTISFSEIMFNIFVDEYKKYGKSESTLKSLNNNNIFMLEYKNLNSNIRSSLFNPNEFTHNNLDKMIKYYGYKNLKDFKTKISEYNHKIVKIEYLSEKIDTGTITIDGNELFHNYHTFAIESGIYIKNSNLSEIADIEYLQKKLFTALRVPKPFLGFEETNGDGKNLALQDIRFTRTINRIQQSMVQELNKIAIVHLYLLGLEDELENFTLSLNNPSTQADMLRTEQLQQKIQVYKDSVADAGNGFGAMSMTRAKKEILGMSEEDIRLDIEQQRLEKAAAAELANTANVIKKTGIFDKIDRMYGEFGVTPEEAAKTAEGAEGGEGMGGMEPSFGGGGSMSTPPTESPEEPEPTESPEPAAEGFNRSSDNLLTEEVSKRKFEEKMKKYKNIYTNRLLESLDRENEKLNKVSNIDKNKDFLNDEIDKISKFIDDVIKD